MGDRRFTDEEAARILQRAAELQARRDATTSGISLDELQRVAQEAGLDPALVARAAESTSRAPLDGNTSLTARVFGAPFLVRQELEVEGEITIDDHELIAHIVRRTLGEPGQISAVGRSITFTSTMQNKITTVTVASRHGRTEIVAETRLGNLAGGLFGGIGGGVGGGVTPMIVIGAAALGGPLAATAAGVAFFGAVWAAIRVGYRKTAENQNEKLRSVVEEIASELGERVTHREGTTLEDARARQGFASATAGEGSPVAVPIAATVERRR